MERVLGRRSCQCGIDAFRSDFGNRFQDSRSRGMTGIFFGIDRGALVASLKLARFAIAACH
jgi:hypothetical protein